MKKMNWIAATLAVLMCLGIAVDAQAEVPGTMTYNGKLSDGSGQPLDTTVEATFRLYDAQSGGAEVWSETFSTIDVNDGNFTAQLGAQEPLVDVFDGSSYWLEVTIEGETLSPRTPVESVPYALRANKASDADTLQGSSVADLNAAMPTTAADLAYDNTASGLSATDAQAALDELAQLRARVDNLESGLQDSSGNTIDVAGFDSRISQNETSVSTLESDMTSAKADITTLEGDMTSAQADIATLETDVTSAQADIATLETDVTSAQADIATLESDVLANANDLATNASAITANTSSISTNASDIATNAVGLSTLNSLTQDMGRTTIGGEPAVTFTGVNFYVRNGLGATDGNTGSGPMVNGVGNLIVGYDEPRTSESDKSGSHNIIVGKENNYTSYGGLIAGRFNASTAPYASVSGGQFNTASGPNSSISGGVANESTGSFSSVSGGRSNKAAGLQSSVSGGTNNTASGNYTSINGGDGLTFSTDHERDVTALENLTQDMARITIGGEPAVAFTGVNVHVRNGQGATASTVNGVGNLVVGYDEARSSGSDKSGSHNLVVGPEHNYTSYGGFIAGKQNAVTAGHASATGGTHNSASGNYASVNGAYNLASGLYASVSGGTFNKATGDAASISGGQLNRASGTSSSVNGGSSVTVSTNNYSDVTALEDLTQDMERTTIHGNPAVTFTGVNVYVRSGTGSTSGPINGLGNLVVGYDESSGTGSDKSGSHNLVVGQGHRYLGYGGFIAGSNNEISGSHASVSGGLYNGAYGDESSISGGKWGMVTGAQDWQAGSLFEDN